VCLTFNHTRLSAVVSRSLPLALVYVHVNGLSGSTSIEVAGTPQGPISASQTQEIGKNLEPLLKISQSDQTVTIPDPFGSGTLRLAVIPIGCEGDCGVLVAGSQQPEFPSQTDRLILTVAANQAAIVLQQKRSEQQVRRREQELTDFFENATVGLHWVGPDGMILRANKAELKLLGYSPDEYIGHHIAEFHADQDVIADILRRLKADETLQDYEARMRCKDGSIKDVLIDSSVLWENGKFIHTRCFTRDITDRKRAEEALRESEERYRQLVALLPVAVYTCEAGTNIITFYNEQAATLWGRAPRVGDTNERFCGSYKLWLPDGTFLPHDQTPMAVALHEGRAFRNQEVVIERPDGTCITVLVNIDPVRDAEGRLVGAVNVFHDTTALKQAEAALRQSERRFREMINALPAAVYTTDTEGRLTHFNPACIEFSGRTPELGNDRWCVSWRLYYPDGTPMPHDQCPMAVAMKEGRPVRGQEIIAERPDGTRVWCEPHPTPLRDAEGQIIGGINMLVDVTERKQMEATLRERETWLAGQSEALEAALNGAPLVTSLGLLVRTATGLLGPDVRAAFYLANPEGTAMHHVVGMHPDYAAAVDGFEIGPDSLACGLAAHTGQPILTSDVTQEPLWASWLWLAEKFDFRGCWSIPIHTSARKYVGSLAIYWRQPCEATARDVEFVSQVSQAAAIIIARHQEAEDRSRAQAAERKQTERLRLLWEAAAVLLKADNPDTMLRGLLGKIGSHLGVDTYFNFLVNDSGDALRLASYEGIPEETARTITRLEFGQAVCGTVALHRQPIVATRIQQSDDPKVQLVKSFGIRSYACNPLLAGDRLFGTLSFASRIRDEFDPDEVAFIETICHYATMAYERLRLLNELKEADRRKDEFLATLAHELRNPLAPVRNAVKVLNLKGSDLPEARRCRSVIERQVEHLTRLIDDLLDISRISRNKLELRRERIELAEVINSAVESSRPLVEQRGHELTVTLPPEPVYLNGDMVRLAQTFLNLLNNAAKYTERGGHIALIAEREGGEMVVRVRDTGVGFPPEKVSRLFEMFYQVDNSLEKSEGGLGIGLSLVKRLVELHGGSVKAHSNGVGKGSEFIVRLPVLVEKPQPQPSHELDTNGQPKVIIARRILVVDDNQDSADSIARLLQLKGNEVYTAYDGLQGVEAAEQLRPDVVMLDIGMPRLNGEDACRRIRAEAWGKDIVLIALTGWGQEEDRRRCVDAGFDHHLTKPVDYDALMKLLDSQAQEQEHRLSNR
jgi:PAS domain S-box-containing protein